MAKIIITNTSSGPFSLDFKVGSISIRDKLEIGGTIDVGARGIAIDDINANDDIKSLVSAGKISVTSQAEGDDVDVESLQLVGGIGVFGQDPPAEQPAVTDPVGGTVVDIQARAAINGLLTALRAAGFIAPPEL